jgi:hypothetical protein
MKFSIGRIAFTDHCINVAHSIYKDHKGRTKETFTLADAHENPT